MPECIQVVPKGVLVSSSWGGTTISHSCNQMQKEASQKAHVIDRCMKAVCLTSSFAVCTITMPVPVLIIDGVQRMGAVPTLETVFLPFLM